MNWKEYLFVWTIGVLLGASLAIWITNLIEKVSNPVEKEEATVTWKARHFRLNESNLYDELIAQEVAFPEIVLAQALLETGNFKSYSCTNRNNLFGLMNRNGTYMSFDHWTESVDAYKNYIQKWETAPKDYYHYLDSLGYAEDTFYIDKVKQIVNKNK